MSQEKKTVKPTAAKTHIPSKSTNLRYVITLNCLLHGEPFKNYFSVIARNNMTIDELRTLIKKKNKPKFDNIAVRLIRLWIVDIPFSSNSLGDSSKDIVTTLNGTKFLPPNKVGGIFTTQPSKNHIHIIVELLATISK